MHESHKNIYYLSTLDKFKINLVKTIDCGLISFSE